LKPHHLIFLREKPANKHCPTDPPLGTPRSVAGTFVPSLIKRLIPGTFHGRFESKYLQNYLDDYVFRFNRRKSKSIGNKCMRMVQQVVKSANEISPWY